MIGKGLPSRLRRRDPGYRIIIRGVRRTVVALLAFYVCRYGFGNVVLATYAIFGAIAASVFVRLPGPAWQRSRLLLAALPAAWVLIAAGTGLAVNTWAAVAGVLLIGFAVAFVGVGGPRLVGLASAFQLFYILACFPPYQPESLPARLIGTTVGITLAALSETLLWPDPAPISYNQRLGEAAQSVAELVEAAADVIAGRAGAQEVLVRRRDRAEDAIDRTRMKGSPRTELPISVHRRDRALRDGATAIREIAEQARWLVERFGANAGHHPDAARLLRGCAENTRLAGRALLSGRPSPGVDDQLGAVSMAPEPEVATEPQPLDLDRLRLQISLHSMTEHVRIFAIATRLAVGLPILPDDAHPVGGEGAFWYARRTTASLFWQELRVHLTPASVYFQGAIRLAVALGAARAVAGGLDLKHGFWVLLATLTIMRSSAVGTRSTLLLAVVGTVIGASASALLLEFTQGPVRYGVELPIAMVLAFAVGPLLGLAWAQAMLTLMLTLVFAQLAPSGWHLAGVRVMDVLIGGGIGIVAGLVMWPRGGGGALRRGVAAYLRCCADVIEESVKVLADRDGSHETLPAARRGLILADASLCQFYLERPDPRTSRVHWETLMVAGQHIVHGAEVLRHRYPAGYLASWPAAEAVLADVAGPLRRGYLDVVRELPGGQISRPATPPTATQAIDDRVTAVVTASGPRPEVVCLVEFDGWLADLTEHLDSVQAASPQASPAADGRHP